MNKKMILFAALVAASGTAFVSCSSNDEDVLAQEPVAPVVEEILVPDTNSVQGTPFTVKAFSGIDDTRAVRYGADGKEVNSGTGWISEIKLWGQQAEASSPWLNSVVFSRTSAESDSWSPARQNNGNPLASITWPTTNAAKATTFYGITDGKIASGDGNHIDGVTENFGEGKFVYNPATAVISHYADGLKYNATEAAEGYAFGWVHAADPQSVEIEDFSVVDNSKIGDLMVATVEKTQTADGSIPMAFEHALCGLYVSAKFCPVDQKWVTADDLNNKFTFLGLRLHGIATGGTYTYGSGWSNLTGTTGMYYYGFGVYEDGGGKSVQAEITTATPHKEPLVPSGTWLLVPQEVTGWDCSYNNANLPSSGAYIEILYTHGGCDPITKYQGIALYPLPSMTFEAGHNYHLIIDVEKVRVSNLDSYKDSGASGKDGKCDYVFRPTESGGL